MANPNTILLKVNGLSLKAEEATVASGVTVTPGNILELDNAGKVKPHATSGAGWLAAVATEDSFQGKTIDDTYAAGDLCFFHYLMPSDTFYGLLKEGNTITQSQWLMSNGDGRLTAATGTGAIGICKAEEAVTIAGTGSTGRIRARVVGGPKTF